MSTLLTDPRLADCRRLFLHNYVVPTRIGVHEFERQGSQRLLVNVDLYVPLAQSTPTADDLSEVVDYDFIRSTVQQRVAQGHIQLQETLADDLLRELLAHPQVRAVLLSTAKPDVYPDCDAVGVQVFGIKEARG